ncbi:MAG: cell division protein FtsQ/DivIB [Puniceicoccales bacterium]
MSPRRRSQSGPTQVRSWKSIQQKVPRSAGTRRRRKNRDLMVWIGAIVFSVGLIFVSYLLLFEPESLFHAGGDEPIEEIEFYTDGSLSKPWTLDRMELPEEATLLQTDIFSLRERMESHPQVRKCVIQRKFPAKLIVRVEERAPVLRIRIKGEDGRPDTLFVARDGVVFPGLGRDPSETRRMPFLTGVDLVANPNGYAPIPGFRVVADLIDTAKSAYPAMFKTWRIVDLSLYDPDPAASFSAIRVRSTNVSEILFGVGDFGGELLNLNDILTLTRERGVEKLKRVDLRFEESVPVVPGQQTRG